MAEYKPFNLMKRDEQRQLLINLHATFDTGSGRKVLEYLSAMCLEHETTFANDPYRTAYNEGGRSVIIQIRNLLAAKEI